MPSISVLWVWDRAGESEDRSARARLREPRLWVLKIEEEGFLEVRGRPVVWVEGVDERSEVRVVEKREEGADMVVGLVDPDSVETQL